MEVAVSKQKLTELLTIYRGGNVPPVLSVEKICEQYKEHPQLSWYRKHDGSRVDAVVKLILLNMIKLVQVENSIQVKDVPMIASSIIADFYWFRIPDLENAINRIIKGQFKVFGRLDMPVIYEALNEYDEIRTKAWVRFRDSQEGQHTVHDDRKPGEKRETLTIKDLKTLGGIASDSAE